MNNKSVFRKYKKKNIFISKNNILNSIPEDNFDKPNKELSKTKVEWRWRLLNINSNEYIEISKKLKDNNMLYINNKSEWVNREISQDYDKFVDKEIYAYLDE